ncbi:MAG: response regulator [Kiritimatiellales bacterium]|nr:response regulator [Kiritimatiellales bacterium]
MSFNSFLYSSCGPAAMKVMYNDVTLHYMALWTFVCGAALVWLVMHLRRNAHIRKNIYDSERSQTQLKEVLQHSREALYRFDLTAGEFEYLSPACFSLTGYVAGELKQMGMSKLLQCVHPEDQEKIFRLTTELRRQSKEREWQGVVEYRFMHRDGQYRSLSDHLYVVYDSFGEASVVSGSVRDVTQIVRLEESLRVLERKFHESQKMAGLGLLSSGIAHDFNNLMTVVLGNAELASMEEANVESGPLEEIKKTTLRAAELANQMLVYTGKTTLVVGSINLSSVVREMGALLDVSISKKVGIKYCLAENIPSIRGDVSQIRQVAMNLITNASEAIGDRQGVIAINIHEVYVRPGEVKNMYPPGSVVRGRHVLLEVSDTGVGMDEQTLSRIFDPQFTTKVTGRGLGLASLLNAVQRHNGAVEVESTVGEGTVFRVYFPAEEQAKEELVEGAADSDDNWRGYGMALIADDEEAIRLITTTLLERIGFRVISAADGLETVDLYTQHAENITFLLLDINMPGLNGLEAALRIRHINPNVPILFMSGYPREEVMERFEHNKHTDFIKKPFESIALKKTIRAVMEARLNGQN